MFELLGLIHTDVCDLKYVQPPNANKYFITFIDDCIKYCYVYLLKSKNEVWDKYIPYKNEVENQLSKKIKVVWSDRGGEYESPFGGYCEELSTKLQLFWSKLPNLYVRKWVSDIQGSSELS